jgi:SNF2 family DNA or RNA helicase
VTMTLTEDVIVPEVRMTHWGIPIVKRNILGQTKGQRLKYVWKTRPYHHQVAAVKKLLSNGYGGALLMAPRTGKTKVAIDYASIMHMAGKVNRVIVFCPVSVMGVWEDQLKMHCPVPYRLLVWDKKARKKNRETGRRRQELPRYGKDILDIVVINYDALSVAGAPVIDRKTGKPKRHGEDGAIKRSRKRGGRYEMKKLILDWQPDLVMLDESHRCKSPSAKKTKMIVSIGEKTPYRVIMTGTAVTKKKRIFDIYAQWQFVNKERFAGLTFTEFKSEFSVMTNRNGYPQWLKNKNTRRLRQLIHQDAFAVTREECFDLPARLEPEIIKVPLEESAKVYDDMARDMIAKIHTGDITEASIKLVQGLRLQQITSGIARTESTPENPKGKLIRIGKEKLRILEDRLYDFFEAEEKVVIAARFIVDIQSIERLCKQMKVPTFVLRGGIKRQDRDRIIREFREHDGAAAFIMQPTAGSLGIDLSTAGTFIWYSLISSYVDYTQSEDRIALNPRGTRFIYLLGEGTYDEVMYESLQEDGEVAREIMKKPELLARDHTLAA